MRKTVLLSIPLFVVAGCALGGRDTPEALGTTISQPLYVSFAPGGAVPLGPAPNSGDAIPLRLTSNSSDMTYKTTWTLNAGAALRVTPRAGAPIVLRGAPIVAEYYHMGRFLGVTIGAVQGSQNLYGFVEPVGWEIVPGDAAAPATP